MKKSNSIQVFVLLCGLGLLAGGCLFKSARVQARQFVLTPLPGGTLTSTSRAPAIDVAFVNMPSYLLRDSMVIRKNANEIQVLENSTWAERLDEGFRRVLEENLASLVASGLKAETVRLTVNVQQFDVDTQGRGTLLANWRFSESGATSPLKTGEAHLTRNGPAPSGNPQAVATTLSDLTGQFSHQLATAYNEATESKP
jgi:uncharacterized lipoprotein YmbA